MKNSLDELSEHCRNVRRTVIEITAPVRSSHIGGAFSIVDVLVVLYFEVLEINPSCPDDPSRDILIFSKGHASAALYSVLAERSFFNRALLKEYYVDGGRLPGHPVRGCVPGIEVSTGSLGHGLPMGVGMAIARKIDKNSSRVFVILSDGELNEGSVWEAIMLAGHHQLDNLTVVIDYNKIQSLGRTSEVLDLEPFRAKLSAFGWSVREIDGHDINLIFQTCQSLPFEEGRPSAIIAHTVKGKGVSFMENKLEWHYRSLDDPEEYARALREVKNS